jgi:hypothetical protein
MVLNLKHAQAEKLPRLEGIATMAFSSDLRHDAIESEKPLRYGRLRFLSELQLYKT